jgi:hypothetical protein
LLKAAPYSGTMGQLKDEFLASGRLSGNNRHRYQEIWSTSG